MLVRHENGTVILNAMTVAMIPNMKNSGPRAEPCGTPVFTFDVNALCVSMNYVCCGNNLGMMGSWSANGCIQKIRKTIIFGGLLPSWYHITNFLKEFPLSFLVTYLCMYFSGQEK